jgi:hypothetical protein
MVKQPPTEELLFQVAQQQNENDKPFIIECEAEGEPAPKYVCLYVFGYKQNGVNEQFWILHEEEICDLYRLSMTVKL